jgi:hypothetical protein
MSSALLGEFAKTRQLAIGLLQLGGLESDKKKQQVASPS